MRNIVWRIVLVLIVLAICFFALYPPQQKLRYGKDLQGGTSLIYLVKMPDTVDRTAVLAQTIEVLKNRVNPTGVLDISMQPLGSDRIEIVMPLPNEQVLNLRKEYDAALDELLKLAQVRTSDLDAALQSNQAVAQFGGGGESDRSKQISQLQDLYNKMKSAQQARDEAVQQNVPREELNKLEQSLADAQLDFESLDQQVGKASLERPRVMRMLGLPTVPLVKKDENGKPLRDEHGRDIKGPGERETMLATLKGEFPHLAGQFDKVVAAYDTYQTHRTALDDPEDLMRLLRGAGVLEYHIAVRPGSPEGVSVEELRKQLNDVGPENTDSTIARWYPINELKQWYDPDKPQQLAFLESNPESYFAARGLVGAKYEGQYYMLLYTTRTKSMVHNEEQQWTVEGTGITADQLGRPAVSFSLDNAGGNLMSRLTGQHINEPMAIVLDGQVYSAPNINGQIGKHGIIEGSFTQAELNYLTRVLASGALSARLGEHPLGIQTLGPSVGKDNLARGLKACFLCIVVVGVFMICYYFFFGLVADFALLINGIIIFGVMALMQAAFTLPGLAGVALTIGMAVDANVLIYERIREEIQHSGLDLRNAIRIGYHKAFSAIFDGHVTSLLVSVVLYYTATTEVKGFAITMIIGLSASLFTALFITRLIFNIATDVFGVKHLSMLAMKFPVIQHMMHPNINWIRLRGIFITCSIIATVGSIVLVFMRGADIFDTEFRGGVAATMRTARLDPTNPDSPRKWLAQTGPNGVETRLRKLGQSAEASARATAADTNDPAKRQYAAIMHEIAKATVLTVGETQLNEGVVEAQSFQISVANPKGIEREDTIRDTIVAELVKEFERDLDISKPLQFEGAGSTNHSLYTFPITSGKLGDSISQPQLTDNVDQYKGGVAVVFNNIDPPVQLSDVKSRVDRMRRQPDFSDAAGRITGVVGLRAVDPTNPRKGYTSVAVLVSDDTVNYNKVNFEVWNSRMAAREWKLTSEALQQQSSLEQVSIFSSAVAETLTAGAVVATTMSLLGILVYLWVRFGSIRYASGAIIALVHDVFICLGALALSQMVAGSPIASFLGVDSFRINLDVVAALLTIIGYSVNDTIVILDRIRENRGKLRLATPAIVNASINQTMSRTFLTSGTVLMSVLVLYTIGGPGLRALSFTLLIGLITGTYSTVAIAAPLTIRADQGVRPDPKVPSSPHKASLEKPEPAGTTVPA